MYHKVGIQNLSPTQVSRILNGHRVRIKSGKGQEMHLSNEQHKKLTSASKKGCGITVEFDPYQMDMNQHLRGAKKTKAMKGDGFFDSALKIGKTLGKKVAPVLIDYGADQLKGAIANSGDGIRRATRAKKPVAKKGVAKKGGAKGGALRTAGYGIKKDGKGYFAGKLGEFIGNEFIPF
jgi:hypothetical protein